MRPDATQCLLADARRLMSTPVFHQSLGDFLRGH
jgi:hypothetical protein